MILSELVRGNEDHPAYRALEVANGGRHYDFLQSVVETAVAVGKPFLSQTVVKAINYHAIACLHPYAGEYRPCAVTVGDHDPPDHYRVNALMDDFVNEVNRYWNDWDEVSLAAYVLWRLNWIHPFINGNGRTARAACYFVLCVKLGGWLPGTIIRNCPGSCCENSLGFGTTLPTRRPCAPLWSPGFTAHDAPLADCDR